MDMSFHEACCQLASPDWYLVKDGKDYPGGQSSESGEDRSVMICHDLLKMAFPASPRSPRSPGIGSELATMASSTTSAQRDGEVKGK